MVNINSYKRLIKAWTENHPEGKVDDFIDFCEELIPPSEYIAHQWLIQESTAWFQHLLDNKKHQKFSLLKDDFINKK